MKKIIAAALLLFNIAAFAQENENWKFSAQIQARTELDGRDFSNETYPPNFASLRTRLAVEKSFMQKLNMFVQIQDSRVFGEEPNTLASIDNIDLHQAYFKLTNLFNAPIEFQAGRFEMKYGTERFFGAVGWHYVGRSFDGVKFSLNLPFKLDLFGLSTRNSIDYIANATRAAYINPVPDNSFSIYGFWNQNKFNNEKTLLDIFGYYEVDRTKNAENESALKRATIGMTYIGKYDNLNPIVEAAIQTGKAGSNEISAYLISAQAKYNANPFNFGAGIDILSGSEPEDGLKNTFAPSYGTNHKFYGFMDYFINVPANTFGLGLNDFYLMFDFAPNRSKWSFSADLHHFAANKSVELFNEQLRNEEQSALGQELDLTLRYNFVKGTTLTWGGSLFFPGELMKINFNGEDTAFWTYLMATVNL